MEKIFWKNEKMLDKKKLMWYSIGSSERTADH